MRRKPTADGALASTTSPGIWLILTSALRLVRTTSTGSWTFFLPRPTARSLSSPPMKPWLGSATRGASSKLRKMEGMMIPLAKDVAALVGDWAEGVENRSLLHEKFALPKVWGAGE